MTAKDKSQELIGRFLTGIEFDVQSQSCMDWTSAKQCALIYIEGLIDELQKQVPCGNPQMNDHRIKFYNEVRTEIEKL